MTLLNRFNVYMLYVGARWIASYCLVRLCFAFVGTQHAPLCLSLFDSQQVSTRTYPCIRKTHITSHHIILMESECLMQEKSPSAQHCLCHIQNINMYFERLKRMTYSNLRAHDSLHTCFGVDANKFNSILVCLIPLYYTWLSLSLSLCVVCFVAVSFYRNEHFRRGPQSKRYWLR